MSNETDAATVIAEEPHSILLDTTNAGVEIAPDSSIPEVTETIMIAEVSPGIIGIAETFPKKVVAVTLDTFEHAGKKYKVLLPQVEIPDLGILTALDILSDVTAQEYLVTQNAIGSVIQEVLE